MSGRADSLIESIRIELVRSLYDAFVPSAIMSVGFVAAGCLIAWITRDPVLALLVVLGAIAGAARLWVAWRYRHEAKDPELTLARAKVLERGFAGAYFYFAGVLGLFGARVLSFPGAEMHMLMICLLVGYAAGVAQLMSLRPWIAFPSMLVAVIPGAVAALFHGDPIYVVTGVMTLALLAGGSQSVFQRHLNTSREIARRITFAELARLDALTELPNRLALREWFEERITLNPRRGAVAVHCLDLDGFKPVNDAFGHPVGDQLLMAVAKRLAWAIQPKDIVARLGGDEFCVIQRDVSGVADAEVLAQRLVQALGQPFRIEGHVLRISTSVGFVISSDNAHDLERLLARADEALYVAKRKGSGVEHSEPQLHAVA